MVLLNNDFLDNILDRGLKARYSENSQIFLTDLKNLLLAKNRLNLGNFVDGKCVGSTSGELGGGGGSGLPPKERDERPTTNQSEYTDTESTLVFEDNSPNRY